MGGCGGVEASGAGQGVAARPATAAAALPTCTKGISIFFCSSSVAIVQRVWGESDRGPPVTTAVPWDFNRAVTKQEGAFPCRLLQSTGRPAPAQPACALPALCASALINWRTVEPMKRCERRF